jgi:Zn-dependent M32 family carboxypeptidase
MTEQRDRRAIEHEIEVYRALLREFPDGATNATIRDLIAELEQELRALDG